MDMARGINEPFDSVPEGSNDDAVSDRPMEIGADERRMHVRAYNHWVSLLHGRAYPSIEDLDPENIADFGQHSVLLDFTRGVDDPSIRFLGESLREECGFTPSIQTVGEVPSRSLLSRLTDHYLQIIANRAPIGFEAEFVGQRGHNTLYRGILMPFSSDGESIDFIYGVINWKELVDAETQARLNAEIEESRRAVPQAPVAAAVWADGPSAGFDAVEEAVEVLVHGSSLADQLMLARESAAAARASDTRSRSALYRALSRAYDFALAAEAEPEGYQLLLRDAGLNVQARAPMTPPVKLVFGVDYDKTRLTEFAAALSNAERCQVDFGGFLAFVEAAEGGLKGLVAAERRARRPDQPAEDKAELGRVRLRSASALALADLPTNQEFALVVTRRNAEGVHEVVALVSDETMLDRALRRAAR